MVEIKSIKTYERNGKLYIDSNTTKGRVRISTHLSVNAILNYDELENMVLEKLGLITKLKNCHKNSFKALGIQSLNECEHLKTQTAITYKSTMNVLAREFGNKDLRLITKSDYKKFLDGFNLNTAKKYKAAINKVIEFSNEKFNFGLKKVKGYKGDDPNAKEKIPFTLEQAKLLVEKASGELKNYLIIAFSTGMRCGEILALRFSSCDFERKSILINASRESITNVITSTKTHKKRNILMSEQVRLAILSQKQLVKGEFVFSKNYDQITKQYKQLLLDCDLANGHILYDTRHTFATLAIEKNGWNCLGNLSKMLGHKSVQVTLDHYIKYFPQDENLADVIDFNLRSK